MQKDTKYDGGLPEGEIMSRYTIDGAEFYNQFAVYKCAQGNMIFDAKSGKHIVPMTKKFNGKTFRRISKLLEDQISQKEFSGHQFWPLAQALEDATRNVLVPFTFGVKELNVVEMEYGCTKCGKYFQEKSGKVQSRIFFTHYNKCAGKGIKDVCPNSVCEPNYRKCLAQKLPSQFEYVYVLRKRNSDYVRHSMKLSRGNAHYHVGTQSDIELALCESILGMQTTTFFNDDPLADIVTIINKRVDFCVCAVWNLTHRLEIATVLEILLRKHKLIPALFVVDAGVRGLLRHRRGDSEDINTIDTEDIENMAIKRTTFKRIIWMASEPDLESKYLQRLLSSSPSISFICAGFSAKFCTWFDKNVDYMRLSVVPRNVEINFCVFHPGWFRINCILENPVVIADVSAPILKTLVVVSHEPLEPEFADYLRENRVEPFSDVGENELVRRSKSNEMILVKAENLSKVSQGMDFGCVVCYNVSDDDFVKATTFLADHGPMTRPLNAGIKRLRRAFYVSTLGMAARNNSPSPFIQNGSCLRAAANILLGNEEPLLGCKPTDVPCSYCKQTRSFIA